jgi:hypothetical protein
MKKLLLLTLTSSLLFGGLASTAQLVQAETSNSKVTKKEIPNSTSVKTPAKTSVKRTKTQYDVYMKIGYTAYNKKDYNTALINFRRALKLRVNDTYATKAIQNTEKRLATPSPVKK